MMTSTDRQIYRSRIDRWVWAVLALPVVALVAIGIESAWWVPVVIGAAMAVVYGWLMAGCWYEIDGDTLVVYQFFRPHRMPVMKIRSVARTRGYIATAGMSSRRVTIRFADRSVMRSAMPLEISPADRDGFIARLCEINPQIEILT